MADELPVVPFATQAEWRAWLEEHHAAATGVWMKMARKGSGLPSVTWDEAVDVALCFGWIDGQAKGVDDTHFLQRYTPRSRRSRWSKVNRERIPRLVASGAMTPAGLAEVERAKADGRWDAAYDPPSRATVPEDLRAALDARPGAAAFFAGLNSQNRYAILHRLQNVKKAETRARNVERFADMCARGA
jgi:uncharacterized protein YdeI (YjbR/CyaY-like superfamily)